MRNHLLGALPPDARDALEPHLTRVELTKGSTLELPGDTIRHSLFIESGLVSVVIDVGDVASELGLIGREGMLGIPAFLGSETARYRALVRSAGTALQIPVEALRRVSAERRAVGDIVLRFMQAAFVQVAHTSFANARLIVSKRLARWLLMGHDRIDGDAIELTHDTLSVALGVRRPMVTMALHELEGIHAIKAKRGSIAIRDRRKLKEVAGPAYGGAEAAYAMLIGKPLGRCEPQVKAG